MDAQLKPQPRLSPLPMFHQLQFLIMARLTALAQELPQFQERALPAEALVPPQDSISILPPGQLTWPPVRRELIRLLIRSLPQMGVLLIRPQPILRSPRRLVLWL